MTLAPGLRSSLPRGARRAASLLARAPALAPSAAGLAVAALGVHGLASERSSLARDPLAACGLLLVGAALLIERRRDPARGLLAGCTVAAGLVVVAQLVLLALGPEATDLPLSAPRGITGLMLAVVALALLGARRAAAAPASPGPAGSGSRTTETGRIRASAASCESMGPCLGAGLLGVVVAQLALVGLIGLEREPDLSRGAAAALVLAGLGIAASAARARLAEPAASARARRVALAVAGATTLAFCLVWQLLLLHERERSREGVRRTAHELAEHVRQELEGRVVATLERVADRWELRGGMPRGTWVRDAAEFLEGRPGHASLAVLDGTGAPRAWSPPGAGAGLRRQRATAAAVAALERARRGGAPQVSDALELDAGVPGFWVVIPLQSRDAAAGLPHAFVVASMRYDELLTPHLRPLTALDWGVTVTAGGAHVAGDVGPPRLWRGAEGAALAGTLWRFEVWPTAARVEAARTILPEVALLLGLALSAALAALVDLGLRERLRADEVLRAAERLEREVAQRVDAEARLAAQKQQLERSARALARSNEDLEEFAYVAAHDLRSPLRAIHDLSSWLEEDLGEHIEGESKEHLELLRARVRRMEDLLSSLLDYARVGRARHAVGPVDVAGLAREAWDLLGEPPGFRLVLDPALPRLEAARAPLAQVLQNLLSNAVKHHDRGQGVVRVRAAGPDAGGLWTFVVEDDGPGIPDRHRGRVFGMLKTLRPRDEVEGSGMGLALVKRLVERYGGAVSVHAAPGARGAAVRFTWPAVAPRDERDAVASAPAAGAGDAHVSAASSREPAPQRRRTSRATSPGSRADPGRGCSAPSGAMNASPRP